MSRTDTGCSQRENETVLFRIHVQSSCWCCCSGSCWRAIYIQPMETSVESSTQPRSETSNMRSLLLDKHVTLNLLAYQNILKYIKWSIYGLRSFLLYFAHNFISLVWIAGLLIIMSSEAKSLKSVFCSQISLSFEEWPLTSPWFILFLSPMWIQLLFSMLKFKRKMTVKSSKCKLSWKYYGIGKLCILSKKRRRQIREIKLPIHQPWINQSLFVIINRMV